MAKENQMLELEMSSNTLHNLVSCGTYNTVLDNLIEDLFTLVSDSNNELLFDNDTYYTYLYNNKLFTDAIFEYVKNNIPKEMVLDGVKVTFDVVEFVSPKYYNYSNDSVNIDVTIDTVAVDKLIADEGFANGFDSYLKRTYKSGPGYVNLMPESVNEFVNSNDNVRKYASIINYLLIYEWDPIKEFDIYYHLYENYSLFDFISKDSYELYNNELKELDKLIIDSFRFNKTIDIDNVINDFTIINDYNSIEKYINLKLIELKNKNQLELEFEN